MDIVNKILNDENHHYDAKEENDYENDVSKKEEDPYKLYDMNGNRKNQNIKKANTNIESYSFKKEVEEDKNLNNN